MKPGYSQRLEQCSSPLEQATQDSQLSFRSQRDFPVSNPKVLNLSAKKKKKPRPAPKKSPLVSVSCQKKKIQRFHDSSDEDNSVDEERKRAHKIRIRKQKRRKMPVRVTTSIAKRKKAPHKKQDVSCFSEDSSSSEDDDPTKPSNRSKAQDEDSEEEMEIPYAQAFNTGVPRVFNDRAVEPLRAGDVLAYYNPVFVSGNPMGFRIAQVLKITEDTNFPLELSNGECLGSDCYVKRIREYYKGELYPHEGIRRAIEKFAYAVGDVLPVEKAVFEDRLARIERIFEEGRQAVAQGPPEETGETSSSSSDDDDRVSRSQTPREGLSSKPSTQKKSYRRPSDERISIETDSENQGSHSNSQLLDRKKDSKRALDMEKPRKLCKGDKARGSKTLKEIASSAPPRSDSLPKPVFSPDTPDSTASDSFRDHPLRKPANMSNTKGQIESSSPSTGTKASLSKTPTNSSSNLAQTKRRVKTKAPTSRPPLPKTKRGSKESTLEDTDDDEAIPPSVLCLKKRKGAFGPSPSESPRRAKQSRLTISSFMGNSPEDDDEGAESVREQQKREFRQIVNSSNSHIAKKYDKPSPLTPSESKTTKSKRKEHSFDSSDEFEGSSSSYLIKKQKKKKERQLRKDANTSPLVTATDNAPSRSARSTDSFQDKQPQSSQDTIASYGSSINKGTKQRKGRRRETKKLSKIIGLVLKSTKSPTEQYS